MKRASYVRGGLRAAFGLFLVVAVGCSSVPLMMNGGQSGAAEGGPAGVAGADSESGGAAGEPEGGSIRVVNVFDQIPQFGIYTDSDPPDYSPPNGVVSWSHGTEYVRKLSSRQRAQLGADFAVRVSYYAQCDEYDRLGSVFLLLEPTDQGPEPTDPRIELVRFITPFSDFTQGALATLVYPDADARAYSRTLADPTHDVWIGIAGGSNPHAGDACSKQDGALRAGVTAEFARVGFRYSVDLVSTQPSDAGPSLVLPGISKTDVTRVPVEATLSNPGDAISGRVTVIVSGHGSAAGGDEYRYTKDSVTLNGSEIGAFRTKVDCARYAAFSPRGNPNLFEDNQLGNPRNWCPGAVIPAHSFEVQLAPGENTVGVGMVPSEVPEGSYYSVSLAFSSP